MKINSSLTSEARYPEAAAVYLWRLGWRLIPIHLPTSKAFRDRVGGCIKPEKAGKVPWLSGSFYEWDPTAAPTESLGTVLEWVRSGHQLGVVCGEPSGITVLDIDRREEIPRVERTIPRPPHTIATANGEHWYFAGVSSSRVLRGVGDLKGTGGYVVAPGSLHRSGVRYRSIGDWTQPFMALPTRELETLIPHHETTARPLNPPADSVAIRLRYVDRIPTPVATSQGGEGREPALYRLACRCAREWALTQGEALEVVSYLNRRCLPPLHDVELERVVCNAFRYAKG